MAAMRLSVRLLAAPVWSWFALRQALVERRRPVVELEVGPRHPLPAPEDLDRLASARVSGLWIKLAALSGVGWATVQGVRDALDRVRAAGVFVGVELDHVGNGELYLAAGADRVWMRPLGSVDALGAHGRLRMAGEALARVGLRFDVESAGAYKAFGEVFTRRWPSAENREATRALVDDLQAELERGIAAGRGLSEAEVRAAFAEGPHGAGEAVRRRLVDAAAYPDEVEAELEARFGEDFPRVAFARWARVARARARVTAWMGGGPRVVVAHLDGPVVDGDGAPGSASIAANPVVARLEALREDDGIAAVVLAVRSPGGSATASDRIWRAVARLREKKPVVAHFGDVAASGGYYLAAAATAIVAQPTTFTGSIGVVAGKPVIGDALARLGVYGESVPGAPNSGFFELDTPFSDEARARFRARIDDTYAAFVDRVAKGRGRPVEQIEPLARGRVWSGRRAHALGLVDALGGVDVAIRTAAAAAARGALRRVDERLGPQVPLGLRMLRRMRGSARLLRVWDLAGAIEGGPWAALLASLPGPLGVLARSGGEPLTLCLEEPLSPSEDHRTSGGTA